MAKQYHNSKKKVLDDKGREELREQADQIFGNMNEDVVKKLQKMTIMLGVAEAIRTNKTCDFSVLGAWLFKEKGGVLTTEEFQQISAEAILLMLQEGWLNPNGELAPDVIPILDHHKRVLAGEDLPPPPPPGFNPN